MARRGKRFGLGTKVATTRGIPVSADIDRWRYCPRDPERLTQRDVPAAERAMLAILAHLTTLSQLDLDVARTKAGWVVFDRRR